MQRRCTEALLAKGANLRIPGTSGLRIEDAALRLSVITRIWPGRASCIYRVDGAAPDLATDLREQLGRLGLLHGARRLASRVPAARSLSAVLADLEPGTQRGIMNAGLIRMSLTGFGSDC